MRVLAIAAALSLSACLAHPSPPPPPLPPEVAAGTVLPDSVYAGRFDRYVGRYVSGSDSIVVSRVGGHVFATLPPPAGRQWLRTVGEGTFVDGAGTSYVFMLPPDGPGAMLQTQDDRPAPRIWQRFP